MKRFQRIADVIRSRRDGHRFDTEGKVASHLITALALVAGLVLAHGAPAQAASTLSLNAQAGPPGSSTLNSTDELSANDVVQWNQYFTPGHTTPWRGRGEQTLPSGHRWQAGSLKSSYAVVEWQVGGTWTTLQPTNGTVVTAIRWMYDPRINRTITPPLQASVTFTSDGDGWRAIPYNNNIYVVNHRSNGSPLNCRTAANGGTCSGFPGNGAGLKLTDQPNQLLTASSFQFVTSENAMEAMHFASGQLFNAVNTPSGFKVVCTDLNTLKGCGGWPLNYSKWSGNKDQDDDELAPLELIGTKYFIITPDRKLRCFDIDPNTKQLCGAPYPIQYITNINNDIEPWRVVSTQLDGKLFFSTTRRNGVPETMFCHDPNTNQPCQGWSTDGKSLSADTDGKGGAVPVPAWGSRPSGVCGASGIVCYTTSGAPFTLSNNARNFVQQNRGMHWSYGGNAGPYDTNFNAVYGSRIYLPPNNARGINCFDFSTDSQCSGYPVFTTANNNNNVRTYTLRFHPDPNRPTCLMTMSDEGVGFSFDVNTLQGCNNGGSVTAPLTVNVNPADHYQCDPTAAAVTGWDRVRVTTSGNGLSGITVTMKQSNGQDLPSSLNPVKSVSIDPNSSNNNISLDISNIPYGTYPSLNAIVELQSSGGVNGTITIAADVTWNGPPRQFCFRTQAPSNAPCDTQSTLTVTSRPVLASTDEVVTAEKVFLCNSGPEGYAAAAAATSIRALTADLASGETRTVVLQGRYDLKRFTGDIWGMTLDNSRKLDVNNKVTASAATTFSQASSRPMFLAKQTQDQPPGKMTLAPLEFANASTSQQTALGTTLSGATDDKGQARVDYLRGTDGGGFRSRNGAVLGPVINSAPTVIPQRAIAGLPESLHPGYASYRNTTKRDKPIVMWGGNDGAVHAAEVQPTGLSAAWSLVPDVMLRRASRYTDSTIGQLRANPYFVDNQPMVGHANLGTGASNDWRTVAVVTFGRGARAILALDVTKTTLTDPQSKGVLFEYTNATPGDTNATPGDNNTPPLNDLGYIISRPTSSEALGSHQIVKLSDGRWAVLVGNGVDSNDQSDGPNLAGTGRPVLYAFYLDGASPRWRRFIATNDQALSTGNGLSTPRPVDTNGDGKVDVVYAGDIKGNLWRFDLASVTAPTVSKLYAAGADRPIYTAPLAVRSAWGGWHVVFGTGSYISPLISTTNTTPQQIVSILDKGTGSQVAESILVTQPFTLATGAGIQFRVSDGANVDYADNKLGWKIALEGNEHTVSAPVLLPSGQLRLMTLAPAYNPGVGVPGPRSWVFEMSPAAGVPMADTFDFNGNGTVDQSDRTPATQGGTPRPPMAMAVSGAQFSTPIQLLGPTVSANTSHVLFPSLNIDMSTNTYGAAGTNSSSIAGGPQPASNGISPSPDRKTLGRATWRQVR